MVPNPNAAPMLFDRALLRARQSRASKLGPATFLLERVAGDLGERLRAVLRKFDHSADIGTAGAGLRDALRGQFGALAQVDLPDIESRAAWRWRRPRSISRSRRWRCSSSTICPESSARFVVH